MMQLTIEVPNELGQRLKPLRDRWVEILELGLRQIAPAGYSLHQEVIEFLARGPSPEEIIAFKPSEEAVERVNELLDRNRAGTLTSEERAELEQYKNLDILISLVKARARLHHPGA